MHKLIATIFVVAFVFGCERQNQLPNEAIRETPEKMPHFAAYTGMQESGASRIDPKAEEWPSLVGQRPEFTGKPVRPPSWVSLDPKIRVSGIELKMAGDFTENSLASDALRVGGVLSGGFVKTTELSGRNLYSLSMNGESLMTGSRRWTRQINSLEAAKGLTPVVLQPRHRFM